MMGVGRDAKLAWAVSLTVMHCLGIIITLYRVFYRIRSHGLWWDDYSATISLFMNIASLVILWSQVPSIGDGFLQEPEMQIVFGWLSLFIYDSVIWSSRISLALSIARILPRRQKMFRVTTMLAFIFAGISMAILIQLSVVCGTDKTWYRTPPYQCPLPHILIYFFVSCDIFADLALIIVPLRVFWHIQLSPGKRRLVFAGFFASILTTVSSISSAIILTGSSFDVDKDLLKVTLIQLMAAISLIVCNFLVVTARCYRLLQTSSGTLADPSLTNSQRPSMATATTGASSRHSTVAWTDVSESYFSSYDLDGPANDLSTTSINGQHSS